MAGRENSHLELIRDAAKIFPALADGHGYVSAKIWHCKYKSLAPIAELKNLEELLIATFPDNSFEFFRGLTKLRYLSILHMPKITSLSGLQNLTSLEVLSLSTSPSWDASRKRSVIDSLAPLNGLSKMIHLQLFGVVPHDNSLEPLRQLPSLRSARFSQFPAEEIANFYAGTLLHDSFVPKPYFDR